MWLSTDGHESWVTRSQKKKLYLITLKSWNFRTNSDNSRSITILFNFLKQTFCTQENFSGTFNYELTLTGKSIVLSQVPSDEESGQRNCRL